MIHYAVLLDGGFVRRRLGSTKAQANAQHVKTLIATLTANPLLSGMRLHRIYYYDSTPLESTENRPLQGGPVAFGRQPIATRSLQLFDELKREPFMALRLGDVSFEGWRVDPKKLSHAPGDSVEIKADDLRPQISQKGVDMRIGMDIAALTLKRQVQVIVLVTGDSDFVPAMKFARREGAQLYLAPLGQHVKPAMLEHSDLLLDIAVTAAAP